MNTQVDAHLQPHPKLVPAFLAWTFGWSWGFWGLCILLKNLWPENPPMPYLLLEGTLFTIGVFGPMTASLIVLKKKRLKAIRTYLFSGKKGTWAYFLIHAGALITVYALVAGIRLVDAGILAILPLEFIFMTTLGGGVEEPGWRGFLQPALEKKISFPLATILVGTVWALWHLPFWFYGRFADWGGLDSFPFFWISLIAVAFWLSALYKKTQSLIACNLFHVLYNTVTTTFVGISEATDGDFSKVNPIFYFGGLALLTLYSMSLWYRTDKKEGKQEVKYF
ncbi:CPBP family intramembrane glutamic endopeptidase [Streptococcus dentasini]